MSELDDSVVSLGLIFGGVNAIWLILKEREIEMALAAAEERRNGGEGEWRMNSS